MKAHPYLGWGAIAILSTAAIIYLIYMHVDLDIVAVYLLAVNTVTFALYRYDKLISAHENLTRIPNFLLAGLAILGGSFGALFGIYLKPTHKTGRKYFLLQACVWLSVVAYGVLIYCYFFDEAGRCQEVWHALLQRLNVQLSQE